MEVSLVALVALVSALAILPLTVLLWFCLDQWHGFSEWFPVSRTSPSLEAFRRHANDLRTIIQDPDVIAWQLFSKHVIAETVVEEVCFVAITPVQRKTRLLAAVRDHIAVNPTVVDTFIEVLKMQPYLMNVAHSLERTYNDLKRRGVHSSWKLRLNNRVPWPPRFIPQLSHPNQVPPIDIYASYLRSVYLRQKFPTYGKFPHSPSVKYTNLASVKKERVSKEQADAFTRVTLRGGIDEVARKKVPIAMEEIAVVKNGVWPRCILVEGVPGIGKSTFAWKMCRKWGKGKILCDYQLVILLSLRERRVREAKNVSELFRIYSRQVHKQVVHEVEEMEGRGVLLLFEGYDELPPGYRTGNSLFLDIIRGKELPQGTVLITSRPSASGFLYEECKDYLFQHIEILGFNSENIQSYLESTCGRDLSLLRGIQKYLQCYPHIRTMMYVPLNAAIVVEVYRTSKSNQSTVPRTMTQLYECLVRSLLRRYLSDHKVHGKRCWKIREFDDIPPEVYKQLCELGRIAYVGLVVDRQVIFDDLPADFVTLGLMQCIPELYVDEGAAVSHSFLHLSMQEFMAAFHLSRHPGEHVYNAAIHEKMVMRFLAGITGLVGKKFGTSEAQQLELERDSLHLMFEAQRVGDLLRAADVIVDSEYGWGSGWSKFDWFVLGYCISHSNSSWSVSLEYNSAGEELVRGALEHPVQSQGRISALDVCSLAPQEIQPETFLRLPEHVLIKSLKVLTISWDHIISPAMIPFFQQLTELKKLRIYSGHGTLDKCKALTSIVRTNGALTRLHAHYLDSDGVEHLAAALHDNTTLQRLEIGTHLVGKGTTALAKAITINKSLQKLHVSFCHIDSEGAVQLAAALHANSTLQELIMYHNPVKDKGATALAQALAINTCLWKLNVENCELGHKGTVELMDVLRGENTLQELSIGGNTIGDTGTTAVAEGLRVNKSLERLTLDHCSIDSEGACQLASALHTNRTLKKLEMFKNPIGSIGATALAEALAVNTSLKKLKIGYCDVDSKGACRLAGALCKNSTLEALEMSGNPIGVGGAIALAEALTVNTSLKTLRIWRCDIGSEGACRLADALHTNNSLEELGMVHTPIGVVGATAIAEALTVNTSLRKLFINDNSVGEQGTQIILRSIAQNTTLEILSLPWFCNHLISSSLAGDTVKIMFSK